LAALQRVATVSAKLLGVGGFMSLGGNLGTKWRRLIFQKKTTSEHPKLNTLWKNTTGKSPSCCIVAGEKESQVNDHYP
jgi:hypothetical protein